MLIEPMLNLIRSWQCSWRNGGVYQGHHGLDMASLVMVIDKGSHDLEEYLRNPSLAKGQEAYVSLENFDVDHLKQRRMPYQWL